MITSTMTDQLTPTPEHRSSSALPPPEEMSRADKIKSEVMAGGAVVENGEDELAGGWRGALSMAVIVGLFVWLGVSNIWWFTFVIGVVIAIFFHELGPGASAAGRPSTGCAPSRSARSSGSSV